MFEGRLWIVGQPDEPIHVEATIDNGRFRAVSGSIEIFDWAVDEIEVATRTDGYLLRQGEDELVFATQRTGFTQALASQRGPRHLHGS